MSARSKARVAGFLYLMPIVVGVFSQFVVRSKLFAANDPVATAANLHAMEPLFRLGIAADLVASACYVAVALTLWLLIAGVDEAKWRAQPKVNE